MANEVRIIKGDSGGKDSRWDEVQAIQYEPFIFVMYNGSVCADEDTDNITALLDMLSKYRLDSYWAGDGAFTVNPCTWEINPKWDYRNKVEKYIDGERMYSYDGVVRFSGNFERYSWAFGIDTNHKPTIDALMTAIKNNKNVVEQAA